MSLNILIERLKLHDPLSQDNLTQDLAMQERIRILTPCETRYLMAVVANFDARDGRYIATSFTEQ